MSQINHPTQSSCLGSAEISQAETLKGKGIEPQSMETQELTHEPLHGYRHYKRLAWMRAWHYVASSEHSSHCSFSTPLPSLALSISAHHCLRQNRQIIHLHFSPSFLLPFLFYPSFFYPFIFHVCFMMYFSPLAELRVLTLWPFVFCQSPPTIAWQIADRKADILSLRGLDLVKITFMWNYFSHLSKFLLC